MKKPAKLTFIIENNLISIQNYRIQAIFWEVIETVSNEMDEKNTELMLMIIETQRNREKPSLGYFFG